MENLKNIITKLFGNKEDVEYCFKKSNIFIVENSGIIIGNDSYIYYIILKGSLIDRLNFFAKYHHILSGKIAYTKNKRVAKVFSSEDLGFSKDGSIKFRIK